MHVFAAAARAAGHLEELSHLQGAHAFVRALGERGYDGRAGRHVHARGERFRRKAHLPPESPGTKRKARPKSEG